MENAPMPRLKIHSDPKKERLLAMTQWQCCITKMQYFDQTAVMLLTVV